MDSPSAGKRHWVISINLSHTFYNAEDNAYNFSILPDLMISLRQNQHTLIWHSPSCIYMEN